MVHTLLHSASLLLCWTPVATCFKFSSAYVRLGGVKHHIRDTGDVEPDGPVAILLHGFAGSTEAWDLVGPRLAAGGYRAIAFDRVGFGRTERPPVPTLPVPPVLFGAQLADVLESLGGEPDPPQAGGVALPDARTALAIGLRNPRSGAIRLPWRLAGFADGDNPYSSRFATTRALRALLERVVGESGATRDVYLVGHSAGGAIAVSAVAECVAAAEGGGSSSSTCSSSSSGGGSSPYPPSPLPPGTRLAGVALIAPAVLSPREDPDAFAPGGDGGQEDDEADKDEGLFDALPLPPSLRKRAELEARIAAFRTILSLPNSFGLQTARGIYTNRDLDEAVRGQMHPRMREPAYAPRISALAAKYAAPVTDFPEQWDAALLEVYRADFVPPGPPPWPFAPAAASGGEAKKNAAPLRGRRLLAAVREGKTRLPSPVRTLVISGDSDTVVPPMASQRAAELLGADRYETMAETGHLPMDERPWQLSESLLNFFGTRPSSAIGAEPSESPASLAEFVTAAQRALLEREAVAAAAIDVDVRACASLDDFLASGPHAELTEDGGVRAVVYAFVEPSSWRRVEHMSSGGTLLEFTREPIVSAVNAPSPDEPPVAAGVEEKQAAAAGEGTRRTHAAAEQLQAAPTIALKLVHREAMLELLSMAVGEGGTGDESPLAEDDATSGPTRDDSAVARRVNEVAVAWAMERLAGAEETQPPPLPCMVECDDDRVLDATTRFVQSRVRYEVVAAGEDGSPPVLRVCSPSLATPIGGPRESGSGSGCTFCKVVAPNALMDAMLTLRGGGGGRGGGSMSGAVGGAAGFMLALAVLTSASSLPMAPLLRPAYAAAVAEHKCSPALLRDAREQLELAVQASSVQAWGEAAQVASDKLLDPTRLVDAIGACASGVSSSEPELSSAQKVLTQRVSGLRALLDDLSTKGAASPEEAMRAMNDGTTARIAFYDIVARSGVLQE